MGIPASQEAAVLMGPCGGGWWEHCLALLVFTSALGVRETEMVVPENRNSRKSVRTCLEGKDHIFLI